MTSFLTDKFPYKKYPDKYVMSKGVAWQIIHNRVYRKVNVRTAAFIDKLIKQILKPNTDE